MRILLFPNSYLPCFGGLQTVVHLLAKELLHCGNIVRVITNRYPLYLSNKDKIDKIPIQRYLFLYPNFNDIKRGRIDLFFASLYFFPYNIFNLIRLFKSFQPDIVNVHFPDNQIPFILYLRKRFKFRIVVSLHGDEIERWFYDYPPIGHTSKQKLKALRLILKKADAVTACSGYLLKKAIQLEPSIAGKGFVIYNGIDLIARESTTPFIHQRPYIFSYGRFTYKKGFDILLKAFAQLMQECPEVDLILAGDGEEKKNLEQLANKLGLQNHVIFYGYAGQEKIRQLLTGCQFVVVPSRLEPFGMVILEAMASGKAVVATRSGGPQEIIEEGITGLLVEKENTKALAKAIIRLLKDIDLRNKISIKAKERVKSFSAKNMAEQYLKVYKLN